MTTSISTILKKYLALIFICCCGILSVKATNTDSTVDIMAHWAKLPSKNITITRCRDKSNAKDGNFLHQCSVESVTLSINDSTTSGYIISWHYNDITLDDSYNHTDALTRYILQITKGMTIQFSTDSAGSFKQVLNWDDIKSFLTAKADSMANKPGSANVDAANLLRTKLITLINNKDQLQSVLLQDIQLYFSLYGYSLNLHSAIIYNGFFPNLFGGDPFPTKGKIILKSVDLANNKCEIIWHQAADTAIVKTMITKSLEQQAAIAGKPAPKAGDIPAIQLYDDYYYLFNLKTGWAQKVSYKRTTSTDKMQQVDSVEIRTN